MAKKRRPPPSESSTPRGTADDAFTARILEFVAWARHRAQVVVVASVLVVVLVVGGIVWYQQRSERLDQAAQELEMVQQAAVFMEPAEAQAQIHEYLERFDGTPYAIEARLILAELYLEEGDPGEAIQVLQAVAPGFRSPLAVQATFLLAVAFEEAEAWSDAADTYQELQNRAQFTFQQREATEGLARVHLAISDRPAAILAYETLLAELDEDHPQRARYEMRLAELRAQEL